MISYFYINALLVINKIQFVKFKVSSNIKMPEESKSITRIMKTHLLLLLLLATSVTARMTARGLKDVVEDPISGGIPNDATEDEGQYIVVFTDGSMEYLDRLKAAEANEEDGGERMIRHLSGKSSKSNSKTTKGTKATKATKAAFLTKSRAEVIHADSEEEAAEWETHPEVKYVERGKLTVSRSGSK